MSCVVALLWSETTTVTLCVAKLDLESSSVLAPFTTFATV